ncbi:TetR/AcrR family transcriptional regulator [Corynebacterium propinquum]|uniref:TetR/AcrR family transcriptional regulator n=1 Tax=Corynebacterium propinquum TaxID=43769 RepID=UPI002543EFDA|nr:TetR/AcrR family transcriptional regulator [Corynebacterium propinquum]MDK4301929.1 TetR/AcrR family transcriptional regulator [Corynebacterium propinquum]
MNNRGENNDNDENADNDGHAVTTELAAAITEFIRHGYEHADISQLEDTRSGAPLDKLEWYSHAIAACMDAITPPASALSTDSPVPAECMAHIVHALFTQLDTHRDAVALLAVESLHPVLEAGTTTTMMESSELGLHLDRVLLRGQEAGAFRPGISAQDVFYLVISLSFSRLNHRHLMAMTTRVDTLSAANTAGVRRLVVDAVLSFLTSNIADSEHESYLATTSDEDHDDSGLGIYWD